MYQKYVKAIKERKDDMRSLNELFEEIAYLRAKVEELEGGSNK